MMLCTANREEEEEEVKNWLLPPVLLCLNPAKNLVDRDGEGQT